MDGTCVVDIFLRDGVPADNASIGAIVAAERLVQNTCLESRIRPPQGGFVRDIGKALLCPSHFPGSHSLKNEKGEHRNLGLVMSRYYPQVKSCFGTPILLEYHGRALGDLIPTSSEQIAFGPVGTSGVHITTPLFFRSPSKQSQYTISSCWR